MMGKNNIILLRRGNEGYKNIFLIHDGTGRIEGYFNILQQISHDFTVYGVIPDKEFLYEGEGSILDLSIKKIASSYYQRIVDKNGSDSFYIAGWSTGGFIAFALASLLDRQGKEVKFLGLIDTPTPLESDFKIEKEIKETTKYFVEFIENKNIKEVLSNTEDINEFWDIVFNNDLEFNWDSFLQDSNGFWSSIISKNLNKPELCKLKNICSVLTYYFLGSKYKPSKLSNIDIHYINARDSQIKDPSKWSEYCRSFYSSEVTGDHYSMLDANNCINFSKIFNEYLVKCTNNTVYEKGVIN